jgi:hypothetical protein
MKFPLQMVDVFGSDAFSGQSTGGRRGERRDRHGGNAEAGALVQSVGDGLPSAAETFGCRLSGEDFQSREGAAIRRPPDARQLSRLARGRESTQASWKDHFKSVKQV